MVKNLKVFLVRIRLWIRWRYRDMEPYTNSKTWPRKNGARWWTHRSCHFRIYNNGYTQRDRK